MGNNKSNLTNDIIVDDGSKLYNIKNKHGKVLGQFEFRPSDTNIVKRYEQVVDYFNNFAVPEDTDAAMKAAEQAVIEKMSYLINADSEDTFFSIMGPFSPLPSGELFVENVLNSIARVIENELSVRSKRVQNHMNKYVAKYRK